MIVLKHTFVSASQMFGVLHRLGLEVKRVLLAEKTLIINAESIYPVYYHSLFLKEYQPISVVKSRFEIWKNRVDSRFNALQCTLYKLKNGHLECKIEAVEVRKPPKKTAKKRIKPNKSPALERKR